MLDAMESNPKRNDNFATIRTENLVKNLEEVRRKNQTYFFSKLLTWATSLNVNFSGKLLYFQNFDLECTKNDLFEQRIIITNSVQVYFTCYSECITWTRLLMHIWMLNYALKTGLTWSSKYKFFFKVFEKSKSRLIKKMGIKDLLEFGSQ